MSLDGLVQSLLNPRLASESCLQTLQRSYSRSFGSILFSTQFFMTVVSL